MERIEKTVFLSYRRTNVPWALAIFQNLTQHSCDVFFDYNGIARGDFERVILGNITARAHFLVLLTPPALELMRLYTEAIRLKPGYANAFNNRGNARRAMGDIQGAVQDFEEAIRLGYKPKD